jgi:hypothetical protein
VTSLSESSQGKVGDNREKWRDFWEKLIGIYLTLADSTVIFQKERKRVEGYMQKEITGMQDSNRNKNLTLNRCP